MAPRTVDKQRKSPAVPTSNTPAEILSADAGTGGDHRLISGIRPTVKSGRIDLGDLEEIQVLDQNGEIVDESHDPSSRTMNCCESIARW